MNTKPNRSVTAAFIFASLFAAAMARGDAWQDSIHYRFGDSRAPIATIEDEIRKAAPDQYPTIEAKLLGALQRPDASTDAKRYYLRMLGTVGSAKSVPAIVAFLGDEQLADCARLALEPMTDKQVTLALRSSLSAVKGKSLIGLIGTIGVRRDADAVKPLAILLKNDDADVAAAAVVALGEIGTRDAAAVLAKFTGGAPAAAQRVVAARLNCANHLIANGEKSAGLAIFEELFSANQPPAVREGAFVGLTSNQKKNKVVPMLVDAIQGNDAAVKSAALRVFFKTADETVQQAMMEQLPAMNPPGQTAMLAILGDLPNVPARPALVKIIEASQDPVLRLAAMECLIAHGGPEDVPMLVKSALVKNATENECAKRVLAQMHRSGISDALAQMLPSADGTTRHTIITAIIARRSAAAMPAMFELVKTGDHAGSTEAMKGIGQIGSTKDVPGLVALLLTMGDNDIRDGSVAAIKAIAGRAENPQVCVQAVLHGLEQATTAMAKDSLIRVLADMPDMSVATKLLEIARAGQDEKLSILALRGCVRLASQKEAPAEARLKLLQSVLEAAKRPDEKREALAGLADIPLAGAADLIQPYLKNSDLSLDAATALTRLARDLGPIHRTRFLALMQEVKAMPNATDSLRQNADEAVKAMSNFGQADGYIIGWLLAGPYLKEGKDVGALFDEVFDPEKPGAPGVAWKAIAVPADKKPCIVHLDKLIGGENRIAYLRTQIQSDKDQEIALEAGSDDGIKVWLNGQVVMADNGVHPCTPGQIKAKLNLKSGANTLLVKVTQGGGEWEACLRLRGADGKETSGLTVTPSLE